MPMFWIARAGDYRFMASDVNSPVRSRWLVPTSLVLISVVPVSAGALLVATLAVGARITPDNARFFASPVPGGRAHPHRQRVLRAWPLPVHPR